MENNSLSSTLLQANPSTPISTQTYNSNTGFFGGIFESIQNISFTTWLIIILILAFLGFNIFIYLAKGTQDITSFFNTITQMVSEGKKQTVQEVKTPDATPVIEKKPDSVANATLNKAINTSKPDEPEDDYKAHDASSSLDITGKSGWCYIGEDKGFRTCAQVGVNDKCMSGDIFPSQEICINPNLRS
jgi:hypothetical protein